MMVNVIPLIYESIRLNYVENEYSNVNYMWTKSRLISHMTAQSTFPVMKLEAGYILPKVFSLWNEVPSGTPQ